MSIPNSNSVRGGRGGSGARASGSRRANFGSSLTNSAPTSTISTTGPPPSAPTGPSNSIQSRSDQSQPASRTKQSRGGGTANGNGSGGATARGRGKGKARGGKPRPNGHHPSNQNQQSKGKGKGEASDEEEEVQEEEEEEVDPDADLCFICAEPVKLYSVAPCDHRTCHVCAVRLRALYKKMECTFCKVSQS